jgi:glucoamylase
MIGTVLGFLHSGNLCRLISEISSDRDSENTEWLGSDKSLATIYEIAQSMREEYTINRRYYPSSDSRKALGWAVGRYYEDVYDGAGVRKTGIGNPWYLCTLAQAEFYYRLMHYFKEKTIHITDLTKDFYLDLGYFVAGTEDEELMVGQKYLPGSKEHKDILLAFREKGDAFVRVVRDFAKWNGGLWEQFDRENGVEMGAPNLT